MFHFGIGLPSVKPCTLELFNDFKLIAVSVLYMCQLISLLSGFCIFFLFALEKCLSSPLAVPFISFIKHANTVGSSFSQCLN